MGCEWCGSTWECDGEGGGCYPLGPNPRAPECEPGQLFGFISQDFELEGFLKKRVVAEVVFAETGPDRWDFLPTVEIGEKKIEPKDKHGGEHPHHGRKWQLHEMVDIPFEELDSDGEPTGKTQVIKLRVQAYAYPQKCEQGGKDFQIWPKLRIERL